MPLQGYTYTIPTASIVDIITANTVTFQDAFQFGLSTDTWTLTGQTFEFSVKASRDDSANLALWTSTAGQIVIDDVINRVIHFNVPESVIMAALQVGKYVYDLVMYDTSSPPIRTMLMQGHFYIRQGVGEI
jgi:hypothetical protein